MPGPHAARIAWPVLKKLPVALVVNTNVRLAILTPDAQT